MSVQRQINWQEAISAWVSYDEPDSQKDRSEWSIIRILEQEAESTKLHIVTKLSNFEGPPPPGVAKVQGLVALRKGRRFWDLGHFYKNELSFTLDYKQ